MQDLEDMGRRMKRKRNKKKDRNSIFAKVGTD